MQRTIRGVVRPAWRLAAVRVPSTKLLGRGSPLIRGPLCGEDAVFMPCRMATVDDAPQIARVHCRAWQKAYAGIMPADFLTSLDETSAAERWRNVLSAGSGTVSVCERWSTIAGFCSFGSSRDDDAIPNEGEIYSLNVHPDEWRRGVGRELTASAIAALRARSLAPITLWVASENHRARRFYEALEFSEEGRTRDESLRPGVVVPETKYVLKRLAA